MRKYNHSVDPYKLKEEFDTYKNVRFPTLSTPSSRNEQDHNFNVLYENKGYKSNQVASMPKVSTPGKWVFILLLFTGGEANQRSRLANIGSLSIARFSNSYNNTHEDAKNPYKNVDFKKYKGEIMINDIREDSKYEKAKIDFDLVRRQGKRYLM